MNGLMFFVIVITAMWFGYVYAIYLDIMALFSFSMILVGVYLIVYGLTPEKLEEAKE